MTPHELAWNCGAYYAAFTDTYLGVEIDTTADYPHVSMWDDDTMLTRLIVFCAPQQHEAARAFALALCEQWEANGQADCGCIPLVCTTETWEVVE